MLSQQRLIRRVREKIGKLLTYQNTANKLWGPEISGEMYREDMEFYLSLLTFLENTGE